MKRLVKEQEVTSVVFRRWPNGDVLALFPEIDEGRGLCSSYEHVGQHGGADYLWCVRSTSLATPSDYAPLKSELESIGYRLRVVRRSGRIQKLKGVMA